GTGEEMSGAWGGRAPKLSMLFAAAAATVACTRHANAVTYQVGSGKPFSTIQAAINQAEADAPASTVLPVIQIFTGTYNEVATLHNDPNYNVNAPTKYDGWTIQAAPGANVRLN